MRSILAPFVVAAVFGAIAAEPAAALSLRTFVSAHGVDTNPCTVAAPCRSFAAAFAVSAPGAEIDVLDPAGYGPVTITHAISIQGHGYSGITANNGNAGILINAGANDQVNLRGLLIDGGGSATDAIVFNSGKSLDIQECVIRNAASGIVFGPSGSSALAVSDTLIADNGAAGGGAGIEVSNPTGTGTVTLTLKRVELDNNTMTAVDAESGASGSLDVAVEETVISNNNGGIFTGSNGAPVNGLVRDTTISNNAFGISAAGGTLRLTHSTVTNNVIGLTTGSGGALASYGDNIVDNNGSSATPTTIVRK